VELNRPSDMAERQQRLSYKFQRLRERLREAIETGVLSGKLPGERVLARQFRVNAKTLSKALTDLAAEGLLERTIGRGTFVRGQAEEADKSLGRWLLLCKPGAECLTLGKALQEVNADSEILSDLATLRPSYLNSFTAVIDLHGNLPEVTLRDLILRSLRVILVDSLPKTYSTHSVLIDRQFCASMLTRDVIAAGYMQIYVVHEPGDTEAFEAVRAAARRTNADVRVESLAGKPIGREHVRGTPAFIGASMDIASRVANTLKAMSVKVPTDAAVVGIGLDGSGADYIPCSGYVVSAAQVADSIRQLITEVQVHRPTPLWLVGASLDRGTMRVIDDPASGDGVARRAVGAV
jgi:Bacterial regulatory proteins, gntR family